MNNYKTPVLFADNTSIIVKGINPRDFQFKMENTFDQVNGLK
jgi:hypothetical protein